MAMSASTFSSLVGSSLLERYILEAPLGEGTFGQVFRARLQGSSQTAAIKILKDSTIDDPAIRERMVARFRREAILCSRLRHPQIVRTLESGHTAPRSPSGVDQEPVFFIAFELIEGSTLASVLAREGRLSMSESLLLMTQVLEGLQVAHDHGIIHRDLKPQNLMVVGTGLERHIRILDFGLGGLLEQYQSDLTRLTHSFEVMGTPAYAAPEQLRAEQVTPRADLYSWGLILLECLTGQRVIEGAGLAEIIRLQLSPDPVHVPAWLEPLPLGRLLRSVLQRQASGRPSSVSTVLAELQAIRTSGLDVWAHPPVTPEQSSLTLALRTAPPSAVTGETLLYAPPGGLAATLDSGLPSPRDRAEDSTLSLHPQSEQASAEAAGVRQELGSKRVEPEQEGERAPLPPGAQPESTGAQPDVTAAPPHPAGALQRRPLVLLSASLSLIPRSGASTGGGSLLTQRATRPEVLEELVWQQLRSGYEVAARFDGTVVSVLGNRVLLAFGLDSTRDDDAVRATRAAFLLREDLARLPGAVAEAFEPPVVRLGLHGGLCSVLPSSVGLPTLIGSVITLAQAIEQAAGEGEIRVSQGLISHLRQRFVVRARGMQSLQASAESIPVYQVEEERAPEADSDLGESSSPFVGRSSRLEALLQALEDVRAGTARAITLMGPPGMGKSRLLREFFSRIEGQPQQRLSTACTSESRNRALFPLRRALERLLAVERGVTPETSFAALRGLLQGLALEEAVHLIPLAQLLELPPSVGYAPEKTTPIFQKIQRVASLAALLTALGQQQPVVLVIEDLHWADATTLETLGSLLGALEGARVLLLTTSRPELTATWSAPQHQLWLLEQLDEGDALRLVTAVTGGLQMPGAVFDRLYARAGGVPLFLEELTRSLLESGVLTPQGTRLVLARPLADLLLPDTLRAVLLGRLERLGHALETLQLAAVLGSSVELGLLKVLYPRDEASLAQELKLLIQADFLQAQPDSPGQLRFRHALIRDAVYESLALGRRRQLHARVASILEQSAPEVVEEHPELLAWHHSSADQPVQAIQYGQRAAMTALQRSAYLEALDMTGLARGWLGAVEDEALRLELELALQVVTGPALIATRGFADEAILSLVSRSEALLEGAPNSPLATPVLWILQMFHHTRAHEDRALALSTQLKEKAEATDNLDLLVASLPNLGSCLYGAARFEEARAHLERCIALYDPAQHGHHAMVYGWDSRVFAQSTLSLVLWSMGEVDEALEMARAALRSAEALQDAMSIGQAYIYLGIVHQYRGERDALIAVCQEAIARCEKQGVLMATVLCSILLGWGLRNGELARGASQTVLAMGVHLASSYYRLLVAETELELGLLEDAARTLAEIDVYIQASGEVYYLPEVLRIQARLALARGASSGGTASPEPQGLAHARALLERAVAEARRLKTPPLLARAQAMLDTLTDGA